MFPGRERGLYDLLLSPVYGARPVATPEIVDDELHEHYIFGDSPRQSKEAFSEFSESFDKNMNM